VSQLRARLQRAIGAQAQGPLNLYPLARTPLRTGVFVIMGPSEPRPRRCKSAV
jgi:hypothetical protein